MEIVKAFTNPLNKGRPPLTESSDYHTTLVEAINEAFSVTDLKY